MEDWNIKEIEKFDNQLIKDYIIKIRTEIFNGLGDLQKRNDKIYEIIINEEIKLFYHFKEKFKNLYKSEEVEKLTKLIEIFSYLREIFNINRWRNESLNNLKSLIKD